jgi:hypothetical protein
MFSFFKSVYLSIHEYSQPPSTCHLSVHPTIHPSSPQEDEKNYETVFYKLRSFATYSLGDGINHNTFTCAAISEKIGSNPSGPPNGPH